MAMTLKRKLFWFFAFAPGTLLLALIGLRLLGLLRPFTVPTGAMAPTVNPGDSIVMEGFSYRLRQPQRGEIVVFRTDNIPQIVSHAPGGRGQFYVKRLAGLPGDKIRFSDGKLFVNDTECVLENSTGPIRYLDIPRAPNPPYAAATVPEGHYFVLGDNSQNSWDSCFWGFVPAGDVLGRVTFRYLPLSRSGAVK